MLPCAPKKVFEVVGGYELFPEEAELEEFAWWAAEVLYWAACGRSRFLESVTFIVITVDGIRCIGGARGF